jgi:hypothetical protein
MLAMMQQDVGSMVVASFFLGTRLAKEATDPRELRIREKIIWSNSYCLF